jgi:hypothetical protein
VCDRREEDSENADSSRAEFTDRQGQKFVVSHATKKEQQYDVCWKFQM